VKEALPEVVVAASRLRGAIEETAAALAGADLQRLLASDAFLQKALNDIPPSASLTARQRAQLGLEIDEAQLALGRCRRLGCSLNEFVRLTFEAQGRDLGYPTRDAAAIPMGRTFNERA
jgi:hypothetical protein